MSKPLSTRLAALGATVALALTLSVPAGREAAADGRSLSGAGLTATVPEVQSFTVGSGDAFFLTPATRIIVGDSSLTDEAALLAEELVALDFERDLGMGQAPVVVTTGSPVDGDIVLSIGAVTDTTSTEAYTLTVAGHATITGPNDGAVFLGTRTLLQSLNNAGGAEAGVVKDWPDTEIRSLHVDAARKYYSPAWFNEQIRQMAWIKLNQLQYHFSENEGYRLESTTHPEIVSATYLTKAELGDIIALAAKYHIEVVPALDLPGHMQQALKAHTDWRASQTPEGQNILDYSKPEVRAFVTDLIDEYAPLFPSSAWHLGGDEVFDLYSATPIATRFPTLAAYAKAEVGASATVMDGYVHYLNTVAEYLNTKGKAHVRAWNDALYTPGTTVDLNTNVDVAYWTRWHGSFPTVATIKAKGHRLINFNDAYFYYVLAAPGGAYSTKPSAQKIWNEWKPGVFPKAAGNAQTIPTNDPLLAGASYAIWSDSAEVQTEQEVAAGIKHSLRAMAARSWKAESTATWETFNANTTRIGDAPIPRELVEPVLDLSLSGTPTGTLEPGTAQQWSVLVANDGDDSARSTVTTDLSELLAQAIHGTATTTILDGTGTPVGAPGSNVALNRPVTSSGQEVAGQWGPALAVDGNLDTRFSSNESDSAWIAVELAQPTVVHHVTIAWELAAARYKMQVSDDGTTWTDATAELTAAANSVSTVQLNTTAAVKFVRMQAIERTPAQNGTKYGVSMKEFEIWDGPVEGLTFEDAVFAGTDLEWAGSLPAGYSLRIEFTSTLKADATPGASYTVTSEVGSPYFPAIDTASVTGKVSGTSTTPTVTLTTPPATVTTPPTTPTTTVTSTETATATATTTATATATTTATATATSTVTATTTATATSTATTTATVTSTATATTTVTPTTTGTITTTVTPTVSTTAPTTTPTAGQIDVYTTPGYHDVNGRQWYTTCEPYSQTTRCRTEIWSTTVQYKGGKFVQDTGWHFNNLTYLPAMTRAQWGNNPLANNGTFSSAGRQWRTECDTAATGRGGCRSYIWTDQVLSTRLPNGTWKYAVDQAWVFNNMVLFKTN